MSSQCSVHVKQCSKHCLAVLPVYLSFPRTTIATDGAPAGTLPVELGQCRRMEAFSAFTNRLTSVPGALLAGFVECTRLSAPSQPHCHVSSLLCGRALVCRAVQTI